MSELTFFLQPKKLGLATKWDSPIKIWDTKFKNGTANKIWDTYLETGQQVKSKDI